MSIWTIILAAGQASRFGSPKALAPWKNGTLLSHAISIAPEAKNIVVVTGAHAEEINNALNGTHCIYNANWAQGMGTSITAGLTYAAQHQASLALILPVDQPFVTGAHLQNLAQKSLTQGRCFLTKDGDITGPPAAVPSSFFAKFEHMSGSGLKSVLRDYGLCKGKNILHDIDTQDDLKRLQEQAERAE